MSPLQVLASLLLAAGIGWAAAQPPAPAPRTEEGPTWAQLTPAQQNALQPLHQHWSTIEANRKTKWLQVAGRFAGMPASERQRVQARMSEWAAMTPAERGRARQTFQESRKLPAPDRQAHWEAYRALPDEQRRELASRKPATAAARASEAATPGSAKAKVPVNPRTAAAKPITPTVVQAGPGATTTLVTKPPTPPTHNQPGLPKITATDGFVNRSTLLPQRGPQGAAVQAEPAEPAEPAASAASGARRR